MIWQATWADFGYFQRAGYTRSGSHHARVNGRGQWHEADLAAAHWLQHTCNAPRTTTGMSKPRIDSCSVHAGLREVSAS